MEDLSDVEIERLLKEAEVRLSSASTLARDALPTMQFETSSKHVAQTGIRVPSLPNAMTRVESNAELSVRTVQPPNQKSAKIQANAGPDWFNMPTTDLTPELKSDLQLLGMRETLAGGKRHYKKDASRLAIPKYSQQGIVQDGKMEFLRGKREKKAGSSFLQEVLQSDDTVHRLKRNYGDIQTAKTSGKKGWYKAMSQRRRPR